MQLAARHLPDLIELVRLERRAFAAKLRVARAVLEWSQTELAQRVGLTQRAIHKLEQGETEPRRTTIRAIEEIWREEGVGFEDFPDGSFRLTVQAGLINRPSGGRSRRLRVVRSQLGVTARSHRSQAYRA